MPSLIGNKPNQVPSNGDLGTLAFQDSNAVNLTGGTAVIDNLTADSINLRIDHDLSNIAPSLNLDFANSKTLDPRITFTRASTATFYDGVTTAKAEENLFIYSDDFTSTVGRWASSGTTVTVNSTAAPDGTTTGDTLTATAGTSAKFTEQTRSVFSGIVVMSVYIKAGTHNFVQFLNSGDAQAFANFDVTAGAGVVGTTGTKTTSSIIDAGNGWYRCVAIFNATVAYSNTYRINLVPSASATYNQSLVAAGTETIILWGAQLEQRSAVSAYTPTTTAPITNYIPVLRTAASGVARFEHNPITGESLGLEIEESRANLLTYSDDGSNAAWTKTNLTVSSNVIIAPDGTLTGDKLVDDTTAGVSRILRQNPTTTAVAHTFSVYAKAGERTWVSLGITDSGSTVRLCWFNLSTGVVGTAQTGLTTSIQSVGNGWYRCVATIATALAGTNAARIYLTTADNTSSYTGDGYSGIYIWGAQLEAGAFATSYIPTVASTVTRAADAASITGTNFSNWYNASEGTMYADVVPNASLSNRISLDFNAGGASPNYIALFAQRSSSLGILAFVNANATSQVDISTQTNADGKTVFAYKTNDFAMTRNGAAAFADTSGLVPQGIDRVFIGDDYNAGNAINGTIKKIQYFPRRLPNAELVEMTS